MSNWEFISVRLTGFEFDTKRSLLPWSYSFGYSVTLNLIANIWPLLILCWCHSISEVINPHTIRLQFSWIIHTSLRVKMLLYAAQLVKFRSFSCFRLYLRKLTTPPIFSWFKWWFRAKAQSVFCDST